MIHRGLVKIYSTSGPIRANQDVIHVFVVLVVAPSAPGKDLEIGVPCLRGHGAVVRQYLVHPTASIFSIQEIFHASTGFDRVAKDERSSATVLSQGLEQCLGFEVETEVFVPIRRGRNGNIHQVLFQRGCRPVQTGSLDPNHPRKFRGDGPNDGIRKRRGYEYELRFVQERCRFANGPQLRPECFVDHQDIDLVQDYGLDVR
mmetsp:Transcript_15008/g.32154  ORF Transcript_15008/g.32154 Transcript_15008/m.32154 type:complete len:202 (-) Transcript_15008:1232-1837(-)